MHSFTIKDNSDIRKFLEGDDSFLPASEILYLHSRPLLRPNFLTEVDDLLNFVFIKYGYSKIPDQYIKKLEEYGVRLGIALGKTLTEDVGKDIAFAIRDIYTMCKELENKL